MKKGILIAVVIGMLGWTLYEFVLSSATNKNKQATVDESAPPTDASDPYTVEFEDSDEIGIYRGEIAPDFELTTLDGEQVKLSDYRGQRVMLNFWATWCPPCRAEMPDMQKFQEDKDVQVLAVNLTETESDPSNIPEFLDKLDLSLTVPLDEDSAISTEYNVVAYPTTYMIDSNGRIQFIMMGAMNYDFMVQQFENME